MWEFFRRRSRDANREKLLRRERRRLQICLWFRRGEAIRAAVRGGSDAGRHARVRRAARTHGRAGEMSSVPEVAAGRVPTVYFIDDSATMREVIRIAFRRENFKIIACADAA